jgi:hypothetical protein
MDAETGKIKRYKRTELEKEQIRRAFAGEPQLIELERDANSKCNKCFGKGYTGRNADTGLVQVCPCVMKKRDK